MNDVGTIIVYSNFHFTVLAQPCVPTWRYSLTYRTCMSLAKLTRFFVVRRAGPSETEGLGDRNSSSAVLRTGAGTWIDNFIRVLNVASALGGSFPPLKAATETLNVILEDFRVCDSSVCSRLFVSILRQDVRNNTASLQDLVTEITELLNVLNDWVESHGETVSKNTGLMELFNKFNLYGRLLRSSRE